VRTILAERTDNRIALADEWRGMDISILFQQPTQNNCEAYSSTPVIACSIPNTVDPTLPALEPIAGQPCPSISWLGNTRAIGRLYLTWADIKDQGNNLIAFNGRVIDASRFITQTDPRNLTFTPRIISVFKDSIGSDSTKPLSQSRESLNALNCLQQGNVIGEIGKESIGCVANDTILIFVIFVIFIVLSVKYAALSYRIRFVFALSFHWILSRNLTSRKPKRPVAPSMFDRKDGTLLTTVIDDDPYIIMLVT
jgi:hypothetical protein